MTVVEEPYVFAANDFYKKPVWMFEGNCLGAVDETADGSIFFPDKSNKDVSFAKEICNGRPAKNGVPERKACPVKDRCLEFALENGERWGIWGGTSERERRGLQRTRKRAARIAKQKAADAARKAKEKADAKSGARTGQAKAKATPSAAAKRASSPAEANGATTVTAVKVRRVTK